MTLSRTPEQEELRAVVRKFLGAASAEPAVRLLMESDTGFDPAVWKRMAEELGLQGLLVPEQFGGAGGGWGELTVVLEEMGRSLLCAPFFSTAVLATSALLESGDADAQRTWLPRIAAGRAVATLAVAETDPDAGTTTAVRASGGWTVTGVTAAVLDGTAADLVLVPARTPDGLGLFAVETAQPGVARTALTGIDLTRRQATVEFASAGAEPVGTPGAAEPVLRRVLDLAAVALGAEQLGGAQFCLRDAVEYAKVREQFSRPIGSFQVIKHKWADMVVEIESARAAVLYGARCADVAPDELPAAASVVKSFCSDAFLQVAAQNIQVHGGIGFTWEHHAHLYFRRATWANIFLGDARHHRAQLADRLGIGAAA